MMTLAETIRDQLVKVFTVPQAEVLADCVVKAHDTLATRSDMHELRVTMQETSAEVKELAEQQKQTSTEVKSLATTVGNLGTEVKELVVEHKSMSREIRELAGTVADLTDSVRMLNIRTDKTAGWALEWVVGKHLPSYVGRQIKGCRVIGTLDVIEFLEKCPAAKDLTDEDFDQLRRADLVATGTIDGEPLYLVGEVSFTADNNDVLRAATRAAIVRKSGRPAQPFVACDAIGPLAAELARKEEVWVILKGRLVTPAA
jgi:FtsZ-binding cell division protein ZapB